MSTQFNFLFQSIQLFFRNSFKSRTQFGSTQNFLLTFTLNEEHLMNERIAGKYKVYTSHRKDGDNETEKVVSDVDKVLSEADPLLFD